jgi:hypothetical protein
MELTASKARRAAGKSEHANGIVFPINLPAAYVRTPAQAVAQQRVVNAVLAFLQEPLGE